MSLTSLYLDTLAWCHKHPGERILVSVNEIEGNGTRLVAFERLCIDAGLTVQVTWVYEGVYVSYNP